MNRRYMRPRRCGARRAFTLAESVMSMLVVSVMLVAALNTVGAAVTAEFKMSERSKGVQLAEWLVTEILQQPYEDAVTVGTMGKEIGESGVTRVDFDDVDDYQGWTAVPQDKNGIVLAGADDYTLGVTTEWVTPGDLSVTKLTDTKVKKITVTATRDGRTVAVLCAYRTAAIADPVPVIDRSILQVVTK